MITLLNLGSLVLGLIAWGLPVAILLRPTKNWVMHSILSVGACAISLCFQIFYSYHLVKIEDWSALMDTTGAVASVSAILLIGTIALNAAATLMVRRAV